MTRNQFLALTLAFWLCSIVQATGAIWVDSATGIDVMPTSQPNPGTASGSPLKTIGAALDRLNGLPLGVNTGSETIVYVRGGPGRVYNESIDLPTKWGTLAGTKDGTAQNPIRFIGWVSTANPPNYPAVGTIPPPNVPRTLAAAAQRLVLPSVQPLLTGSLSPHDPNVPIVEQEVH